jgi:hypothetical protein
LVEARGIAARESKCFHTSFGSRPASADVIDISF